MSSRDFKEVFVCAAVTALVVAGVFGTRTAMSEGPEIKGPQVTVQGCKLTASAAPAKELYKVELTVRAQNPASQRRRFDLNMFVVRKDFTGNPLSRVPTPSDDKTTLESDVKVKFDVPASGKAERKVTVLTKARPAPKSEKAEPLTLTLPPSYVISLDREGKQPLAFFSAATAWPKDGENAK